LTGRDWACAAKTQANKIATDQQIRFIGWRSGARYRYGWYGYDVGSRNFKFIFHMIQIG